MGRIINKNLLILIVGFIPGFVALLISVGFGNKDFYSYGFAALIANGLLPVLILNEGRRYYTELSKKDWQKSYFSLLIVSISMFMIYSLLLFFLNFQFNFLEDRGVEISLVSILLFSTCIMAPVTFYQARLFAANNFDLYFYFALSYSTIRSFVLCIGSFYIETILQLAILEVISSLICFAILVLLGNPFRRFNGFTPINFREGIYDGLGVSISNLAFVYIIFVSSKPPLTDAYLMIFAAYRITRPVVNIGSLVPNLIIKENLSSKNILNIFYLLVFSSIIIILLNHFNIISLILKIINSNFDYDHIAFTLFILIAFMSWINGGLTSKFIAVYRKGRILVLVALISVVVVYICSYLTNGIIELLFIWELVVTLLMIIIFFSRIHKYG